MRPPAPTLWVFPLVFYSPTPSFLSASCLSASGMGFPACFSFTAPTLWVFPLVFYSPRPLFSPLPAYQLPGWVFSLDFLFPNPRHGLSGLDPYFHTHFSPHHLPACFWHSFFQLAFLILLIIRHAQQLIHRRRTIFHKLECALL